MYIKCESICFNKLWLLSYHVAKTKTLHLNINWDVFHTNQKSHKSFFICKKETPSFTKPNTSHCHIHVHSLQQNIVNIVRENITISDIKAVSSHSTYCTLYTFTLTCYSQMKKLNNHCHVFFILLKKKQKTKTKCWQTFREHGLHYEWLYRKCLYWTPDTGPKTNNW